LIYVNISLNSTNNKSSSPLKPKYEDIFLKQTGHSANGF